MGAYATIDEYRADSGDETTPEARVSSILEQQSAKLRALVVGSAALNEDQRVLARAIVTDAARKALKPPAIGGVGSVDGASQASFSANGFSGSYTLANPSGAAWFDRSLVSALRRSLGTSQRIGSIAPHYGGPR